MITRLKRGLIYVITALLYIVATLLFWLLDWLEPGMTDHLNDHFDS